MPSPRSLLILIVHVAGVYGLLENLAPTFFRWFRESEGVAALHAKHVASETVVHMMQDTPFASAPDSLKRDFATGPAGDLVAKFMQLEQTHIGDWKREKIIEAAGPGFDAASARAALRGYVDASPAVIFSFVDCPWCLLAKELVAEELARCDAADRAEDALCVVELESLGREGKALRASIALATGRTSMPSVFVGGKACGGFTDGDFPQSDEPGLCLDGGGSGGVQALAASGRLRAMLEEALLAARE